MLPEGVRIDPRSGELSPSTGRYVKRVADLDGLFREPAGGDAVAYEVIEYRQPGSDLVFGTTMIAPGRVGREYYFTRGHFHARPDAGEVYYTQSGEGVLLLRSRAGEVRTVDMRPGVCAFIPPGWAHRSVNTGADTLVFVYVVAADCGNEYAEIERSGMGARIVEQDGHPAVIPHPA